MSSNWSDHTLQTDLLRVSQPDTSKPFASNKDVFDRLIPYHLFSEAALKPRDQAQTWQSIRKLSEPVGNARKRAKVVQDALLEQGDSQQFRNACELCYLESSLIQQEQASSRGS